jgi:hypothetical protein
MLKDFIVAQSTLDAVAVSNGGTAPMVEAAVKQKVAGLTAAFPIYRTRSG